MLQFVLLFNWMLVVYLWIDQVFLPICSSFRATLNRRPVPQRRRRPSKHWSNQDRKVGKSTTTKTTQPQNIYPGKIWRVSTSKFIPMQSDTQQCQNWHFVKWKPNLADLSGRHMKCIRFTSFCFFREKLDSLVRNRKLMQSVVRRSIDIVFFRPFF